MMASRVEVYNGNADKENWQGITIKPIEDEPQCGGDISIEEYLEMVGIISKAEPQTEMGDE